MCQVKHCVSMAQIAIRSYFDFSTPSFNDLPLDFSDMLSALIKEYFFSYSDILSLVSSV